MTAGEHIDPDAVEPWEGTETTNPADWPEWAEDGWVPDEWLGQDASLADLTRLGLRRVQDLRPAPGYLDGVDELRSADFDDEERRP